MTSLIIFSSILHQLILQNLEFWLRIRSCIYWKTERKDGCTESFTKSRKRQSMTLGAAWWLWIQVRIGTWCLWLLLYLIVAIVYFFLSFLVLVSRGVYVMYVYNRGYQPHSIRNTHRDKKKKNYKALFSCIVRKVLTIA